MAALNPNTLDTGTPPIPEAKAWVTSYDGSHGPLIDLSQAAPAVAPPPDMLDRLAAAARDPANAKYGAIAGDAGFREAFAQETNRIYGAAVTPADIAITPGCNQAFVVTMMGVAKAGDAVILPAPFYFNHKMALDLLGIEASILPCHAADGFVPDLATARALITPRTRAIVLVTPNNPTGAIYPPDVIAAFAALCMQKRISGLCWMKLIAIFCLPEQCGLMMSWPSRNGAIPSFSFIVFQNPLPFPAIASAASLQPDRCRTQLHKILDTVQICPARVGQVASTWAINALREWREDNRADINVRAQAFKTAMAGTNGWAVDSVGAYFAYLRHPFASASAAQVAEKLAKTRGILSLPGSYFGPQQETHLRIAFANADAQAITSMPARLRDFSV